jgi:hypothetical protein
MIATRVRPRARAHGALIAAALLGVLSIGEAAAQASGAGLVLPPGDVVGGTVYRRDGSAVPSITTGADANGYIFSVAPTESFLGSAAATVVRTSGDTQYVRFYTDGVTQPVGRFVVKSDVVRGRSAAEIRDLLALPYLPDSLTIVRVPASACVLTGTAGPILGNFAASPPSIPTAGPWGSGGVPQAVLIGVTPDANCADPQFVPSTNYVNRQAIGPNALAYRPLAGGGNALAIASALDRAIPPQAFGDMDGIYDALDLLNTGDGATLRSALTQLGGEAHSGLPSVAIAGAQMLQGALRQQIRLGRTSEPASRPWAATFGGGGRIAGDGDSHDMAYGIGGAIVGLERRLDHALVIGGALAYTRGGFSPSGLPGDGHLETATALLHGRYAAAPWHVEVAAGYGRGWGEMTRAIAFPGVTRTASARPDAHLLIANVESGRRIALDTATALTPFIGFEGVAILRPAFAESGAGAANLHVQRETTASARGTLGLELARSFAISGDRVDRPLHLALRAGWSHDFADTRRTITASLEGTPDVAFTVEGARPGRDAAALGAGLALTLGAIDLVLRYDGLIGNGTGAHALSIGGRVAF